MKRFTFALIAALMIIMSLPFAAYGDTPVSAEPSQADQDTAIKLTVNGRRSDTAQSYGVPVTVDNGIIYIPLRAVADMYEAEYSWDGDTAVMTLSEITAEFSDDSNFIITDGEETELHYPSYVVNGELVVTDEALTCAFGLMVNFKSEKSLVTVIQKDSKREAEIAEKQAEAQNGKNKGSKADEIITVISAMNKGFLATLKLFAITLIGALPLGLIIALCSMSKFVPLKLLTRLLVWIIRGTPLMLQLLIIFYIPGMVMENGSPWPRGEEGRFMAASVAFIINYAFYFSEIFRGGIENVPKGQVEAGQVLGMTKTQIFFHVTLLQMIKRIVPPMSNEIITLVKDTSIARIISMQEVIWAGYAFLKSSHGYSGLLWPLFFTGVYYLLFNGILTVLFSKIEKKLGYFN